MALRKKDTEINYKKVNKMYVLSRRGKLMIERIRKTKLKIGLFAVILFMLSLFIFFSFAFNNDILKKPRISSPEPTKTNFETDPSPTKITSSDKTDSSSTSYEFMSTANASNVSLENGKKTLPIELTQVSNNASNTSHEPSDVASTTCLSAKELNNSSGTNLLKTSSVQKPTEPASNSEIMTSDTENKVKYYFVSQFNVSVFDSPGSGKVKDTLKYATYVTKLDEMSASGTSFTKISYNTKDGKAEGWVRSNILSSSLKPITGEDYKELSFTPVKKVNGRINDVRGIYLTRYSVPNREKIAEWVKFAKSTNLNAFVIDIKDDDGFMLFETDAASKYVPEANKKAFYTKNEMEDILSELKKQGIYVIARIVCFKDPSYARAHPDRSIVYKDTGEPYMGIYKVPWASAYDRQLWEYNVQVAIEAAQLGFDEIQYDYVRFPELSKETRQRVNLRQVGNESYAEAIQKFLIYSKKMLEKYNIPLASDVFGLVSTAVDDVGIGQYWEAISNVVDYICPMVYPSHYANGSFGLSVPDVYPYETVYNALEDGLKRNLNIPTPAKIRPWLQSFTATWVKGHISYYEDEIKKQIKAAKNLGINEYMLWNASNRYIKMWYY